MRIPVVVEAVANNGFRAKSGEPLAVSADGSTTNEAISNLRAEIERQLKNGKQLVSLDVPTGENPWLAMAGMYDPNDPLVKEWKESMAAYRDEVESDPDRP